MFALPPVIVLGTGLVLSVEPWLVTQSIVPDSLTADKMQALPDRYDANEQARTLSYRSYDNTLTESAGCRGGTVVDAATGETLPGPSSLASLFVTMRVTHEHFLFDLGWVVIASSYAMLVLALHGVLMGWPRIRNTLAGWHKPMAWGLLSLIVLSPLTGLFLVYGVTFTSPPAAAGPQGAQLTLREAVDVAGRSQDLSSLVWLRPLGGRLMLRVVEDGEYRLYRVTRAGTTLQPRNWPRLWHEGNFAGVWSSLMNLVISVAMLGLLGTGVWMWVRRKIATRRRPERALCRRSPPRRGQQCHVDRHGGDRLPPSRAPAQRRPAASAGVADVVCGDMTGKWPALGIDAGASRGKLCRCRHA